MTLGVILDMDGLMLDTEPIAFTAFQQASRDLEREFDDEIFNRLIGRDGASARGLLRRHFGDDFPLDQFVRETARRYEELLRLNGVPHKPGLVEFLQFLEERGIPKAVATSTPTDLATSLLDQAGVRAYFGIIVGGDQVRRGKPDPDIFLVTAARLRCRPERCVVLEDSGPGIRAAAAAGMRPILIPDGREPSAEMRRAAHAVVDSLSAATAVITQLLDSPPSP